jgi:hypothetical protein
MSTFKKKDFLNIARLYEPYYKTQEKFYHNFLHALFVVDNGVDILTELDAPEYVKVVFAHAMGAHDAHHLCGKQKSDTENIICALKVFNNINYLDKHPLYKKMGSLIIAGTQVPYVETPETIASWYKGNQDDLILAIQAARDVDHLGIIGIEDQTQREVALTGLMREFSRNTTKEQILASYESATNNFFDSIHFYTQPAKDWARENLTKMRKWQLDYTPEAIENAY